MQLQVITVCCAGIKFLLLMVKFKFFEFANDENKVGRKISVEWFTDSVTMQMICLLDLLGYHSSR